MKRGRYARLYGDLWRDPVVLTLSAAAIGVLTQLMAYCVDADVEGVVPARIVELASRGDAAPVTELVTAGLLTCDASRDSVAASPSPSPETWTITRWETEQRRRSERPSRDTASRHGGERAVKTGAQRTAEWRARKAAEAAAAAAATAPAESADVPSRDGVTERHVTASQTESDAAVIQSSSHPVTEDTHTPRAGARDGQRDPTSSHDQPSIGVVAWVRALERRGRPPTTIEPYRRRLGQLVADVVRAVGPERALAELDRWIDAYLDDRARRSGQVRPDWCAEWVGAELSSGRSPESQRPTRSHGQVRTLPRPELVDWDKEAQGPEAQAARDLYGISQ